MAKNRKNRQPSVRSVNRSMRMFAVALAVLVVIFSIGVHSVLDQAAIHTAEPGVTTLLLVGTDHRSDDTQGRSDTIMLISINETQNQCAVVSLMRDLYVPIPGHEENRINAAYSMGGIELLQKTIEENFEIQLDGHVELDFSAYKTLVDAIGGVDVELTAEEAGYLSGQGSNLVDGVVGRYTEGRTYEVTEGLNHLDGDAALDYVRARHVGTSSDFGRTGRQRKMLQIILKKVKDEGFGTMLKLVQPTLDLVGSDHFSTSFNQYQVLGMGLTALSMVQSGGEEDSELIRTENIPSGNTYRNETQRGMAVLVPNSWETLRSLLHQYLYGASEAD